jgi:hypothetical protein
LQPSRWGSSCTAAVTYTPTNGYTGPDTFTFKANDGTADSNTATVSVTVNAPPVANGQSVTAVLNTPLLITVSATDPDSPSLTFTITANASHGLLSGNLGSTCTPAGGGSSCTATVTYTPNSGYTGPDSLMFKVNDGIADSNVATVSITVDAPPVANGQTATAVLNTALPITLTASDSDSPSLTFAVTANPSHGSLGALGTPSCTPGGGGSTCGAAVTYTPTTGYTGSDSFQFKVNDGTADSNIATVSITVDAPPQVISTAPANGATSVPLTSTISITFSKAVSVTGTAFSLSCTPGAAPSFTVTPASPATTFVLHPSANLPADSSCTVTVTASQVTDSPGGTPMTADYMFSFGTPPQANNDNFPEILIGNVSIDSSKIPYSVTTNDQFNTPITITAFDATSVNGGTVTMTASGVGIGQFTYNPPAGFRGSDTFTYTISNAHGSSTATVQLTISGMIWFINNAAASNGDGRLSSPFNALASFEAINDGGTKHGQNGDTIFLYTGSSSYTGGVTLRAGQFLIGQGASASIASISGLTPPFASPSLPTTGGTNATLTNAGGAGVMLASGNTLNGLTVSGTIGAGITGTGVNTLTVDATVSVTNAGGDALSLTGTPSLAGAIDFAATISGPSGHAVNIQNRNGGTVTLSGPISATSGTGVNLALNTGTTLNFTGGLSLSTGANAAFTATGGGTVNVCDKNPCGTGTAVVNTLTTTTSTAATLNGVGGALTFKSINAGTATLGPTNGISLTSTTGSFTVAGDGTNAANGSGGTIQKATHNGIVINSAASVSLAAMNIQNNGTAAAANDDEGINATNLLGTSSITYSLVTGSTDNNLIVVNNTGTLTSFAITHSTFSNTSTTVGNDGIHFEGRNSAVMSIDVENSTFNHNRGDHFQATTDAASGANMTVTFSNNSLTADSGNFNGCGTAGHPACGTDLGGGITINPSGSAQTNFTIASNNIQGAVASAILVDSGGASTSAALLHGTISGNTIGTAATTDSGSSQGDGIDVFSVAAATTRVVVANNTIKQYANANGIQLNQGSANGTTPSNGNLQATVTGNTISNPGSFATYGIYAFAGIATGDTGTMCADIGGSTTTLYNSITGSGANGATDFEVDQVSSTTVQLPGYTGPAHGSGGTNPAVVTYIKGRNTAGASGNTFDGGGGPGFVGGGACAAP